MKNLYQVAHAENLRSRSEHTERLLLNLYEAALASEYWDDIDQAERANMFNEIRAIVELKRNLEKLAAAPIEMSAN